MVEFVRILGMSKGTGKTLRTIYGESYESEDQACTVVAN